MDQSTMHRVLLDLSQVDLERVEAALLGLAQYRRVSKKEIVRQQLDAVEVARSRGIGFAQIAQALTECGCPISERVLRKYVSQLRKSHARALDGAPSVPARPQAVPAHVADSGAIAVGAASPPDAPRRSLLRSAVLKNAQLEGDK